MEAGSRELKAVGYTSLALFAVSEDGTQPAVRTVRDFVINRGAVQLPLWPVKPQGGSRVHAGMLQEEQRLLCASLLVRVMSVADAKANRCAS